MNLRWRRFAGVGFLLVAIVPASAGQPTNATRARRAPIVFASPRGDTLSFETDSLVEYALEEALRPVGAPVVMTQPHRAVFFRARTNYRLAVLIDPADAESLTKTAAFEEFASRMLWKKRWPAPVASPTGAFEFPRDWNRRGMLELDSTLVAPIRVTWIAFGYDPGRGPSRDHGDMDRDRVLLRDTGVLLGVTFIDPRTGRVTLAP